MSPEDENEDLAQAAPSPASATSDASDAPDPAARMKLVIAYRGRKIEMGRDTDFERIRGYRESQASHPLHLPDDGGSPST